MKIGIYICHCGLNIAHVINMDILQDKIKNEFEDIEIVRDIQFMCSDTGQDAIIEDIKEHNIDRVLIAACSPKLHEKTFQQVIENAGVNPYLLEIVNIREQCSWVHKQHPEMATQKAFDLIKMGVAKLKNLEPLEVKKVPINSNVLVIGGGVAGIEAALNLADAGYYVYMVEKEPSIGGKMALLNEVFPTNDCSICVLAPKMTEVSNHPNIELYTNSEITEITGSVGNFTVKGLKKPRYVSEDKCKGCIEECSSVCPVEISNPFDYGIGKIKAISMPFPQAVPQCAYINDEYCVGCGLCRQVCPADAVDYEQKEEEFSFDAGAVIVATGYNVFDASRKEEYGYSKYPDVITNMELERMINASGPTHGKVVVPSTRETPQKVAFIHCVGSRDETVGNPYCSKVCCMSAIKNAQLLKERYPEMDIRLHYIDIRASGEMYEEYYTNAQSMGIQFVRGKVAEIQEDNSGKPVLRYEDTLENKIFEDTYDLVVLSVGLEANKDEKISSMLNLSTRSDGFYTVSHPKMRPVESNIDGVYIAGCASGPKEIQISIAQGSAVASKAMQLLSRGELETDPMSAFVDTDKCTGCGICQDVCKFGKIKLYNHKAEVDELSCHGCGSCSAACPEDAIYMRNQTDAQIHSQIEAALEVKDEFPLIVSFLCNWCSYACADLAGTSRIQYPTNVRIIRVMCAGRVDPEFVLTAFEKGADGVMVSGCRLGECHYVYGNYNAKQRMDVLKDVLEEIDINPNRLNVEWISASECNRFAESIENFVEELKKIGPIGSEILEAPNAEHTG
jgi:heterodisulfide reductase subunit A